MAKRGRPAGKRKGGRSLEEIQAQIDAREEAAKKRRAERKPTGAAADPEKMFKAKQETEARKKAKEEELIPEGLEDLLNDIKNLPDLDELLESVRSEGKKKDKKKTTEKTAAVFPSPKAEKKESDSIASENINPVILRMLGLDPANVVDIDYDTYKRLLREQMVAGRMAGSKLSSEETQLVTEEFKRVKNKTGRFKVKGQKVRASSFVAKRKEKTSGASSFVAGYLPGRGGALVKTPKAEDPGALVADKLFEVNKNVKGAVDSFAKTQKEEKKSKDAERVAASRAAKTAREEASEAKSIRKQTSKVLKRALAPFKDMFEGVFRFLRNVVFGTAVMEILRFLKDPAEFFRPLVEWSNGLIDRINGWSAKFITDSLKPVNDTVDGFNKKILEVEKTINDLLDKLPGRLGMGQVNLGQVPVLPTQKIIDSTRIGQIPNPGEAIKNAFGSLPASTLSTPGSGYSAGKVPSKVSDDKEFTQGVTALAKKYNVSENDLYAVMGFETGGTYSPSIRNAMGSGATGLIQFMPSTAKGLGTSTDALAKMTRAEQLKYVDKYLSNKGIEGGNLSDIYMSVLFPAAVGKSEDYVLFGKGAMRGYTGRAYTQNRGLDLNNDGSITKVEASSKVRAYLPKGVVSAPTASVTKTQIEKAEVTKSPGPAVTPPPAPVARKPRVVALPAPAQQAPVAGSGAGANQKSVPTFSATDGNNQSMLVIKSIYNIVG